MINEKTTNYYKDIRFWLVLTCLLLLSWLTLQGYPV